MTWSPLAFHKATIENIYGPALVLRLRSDQYVLGTGVSEWTDISGNGFDYVQATDSAQPTPHADGGPNDRAYLAFDGTDDYLSHTGSLGAFPVNGSDSHRLNLTVFMVGKVNTGTDANDGIFTATDGTHNDYANDTYPDVGVIWGAGYNAGDPTGDDIYGFGGGTAGANARLTNEPLALDTWHLVTYCSKPGKWLARRYDGAEALSLTGTGSPVSANPTLWLLGGRLTTTPQLFAKVDLAEIIIVRSCDDAKMAAAEEILLAYYDL